MENTNTEKKPRGKRGQGSVYLPNNSRNWWIKFSVAGRVIQQSANTEKKREAEDFLKMEILKYAIWGRGTGRKGNR